MNAPPPVAVVGAGIAGLACAHALVAAGRGVTLFDKGRVPGGRVCTRDAGDHRFDHGAQYFTLRDPACAGAWSGLAAAGVVRAWPARHRERDGSVSRPAGWRVGAERMDALPRALAGGLTVRTQCRIDAVRRDADGWRLQDGDGRWYGPHRHLVVAVPAPQAAPLLHASPRLARAADTARYAPCWAVLIAHAAPPRLEVDALSRVTPALDWVAHDGGKPGRTGAATWVLHASVTWSREHLEHAPEAVAAALAADFARLHGDSAPVSWRAAHRWRYARVETPHGEDCLLDPALGLGACGDWLTGSRVESAWQSGAALAARLLALG